MREKIAEQVACLPSPLCAARQPTVLAVVIVMLAACSDAYTSGIGAARSGEREHLATPYQMDGTSVFDGSADGGGE